MLQLSPSPSPVHTLARQPWAQPRQAARCERCTTGSLFLDDDTEGGHVLPAEWVCLQCGCRRRVLGRGRR